MIKFRPHHFLCTLGFRGAGYSDAFILNFSEIIEVLNSFEGDSTLIEVVEYADRICEPCPERRGKFCTQQLKIERLDQAHQETLGIKRGDQLTWGEAKERIKSKVNLDAFERMCAGCSWKDMGFCRSALIELIKTR